MQGLARGISLSLPGELQICPWGARAQRDQGKHLKFKKKKKNFERVNSRFNFSPFLINLKYFQSQPRQNQKYRTKLCDKYTKQGVCPYGERCLFIHPNSGPNAYIRPDKMAEVGHNQEMGNTFEKEKNQFRSHYISKIRFENNTFHFLPKLNVEVWIG